MSPIGDAGDREVLQRPQRVDAPVDVVRDLAVTEQVVLGARRAVHRCIPPATGPRHRSRGRLKGDDLGHPAVAVFGTAVLDVDEGLSGSRAPPWRSRHPAATASPPSHFSAPTGVMTAAVPQANTSTMEPSAVPSRHSSMRHATLGDVVTEVAGQRQDRVAGDSRQDRAGQRRRDDRAVGVDEVQVHAAELLDVLVLGRVEERHLRAAVRVCLLLRQQAGRVVAAALGRAGATGTSAPVLGGQPDVDRLDAAGEVRAGGRGDDASR